MKPFSDVTPKIRRDRLTWYLYLVLAVFGFKQAVLGSIMPFLRDELSLTANQIGWHFSSYAIGLILSGIVGRAFASFKRPRLALFATLMVASIAALIFAYSLIVTLSCALALGLTGGLVQADVQGRLARYHGEHRDIAVTEAFILAGLGVCVGSLVIGETVAQGFSWRLAMVVPAVALAFIAFVLRSKTDQVGEVSDPAEMAPMGQVPLGVFACWFMIFLAIAAEWSIGFWGPQFIEVHTSASAASSVTMMAAFFGGTVFGRLVSSRLLSIVGGRAVLVAVMVMGSIAIQVLWGFSSLPLTIAALAVAGMCLGNFFPLILAAAIRRSPNHIAIISSGATQAVGVALLIAPMLLSNVGSTIGIVNALGLVAFVPLIMLAIFFVSYRSASSSAQPMPLIIPRR